MAESTVEVTTGWDNRIVGYENVPPDQLTANDKNWRTHPARQRRELEKVLDDVGWVQDVIVNKRTGRIVDGHLRVSVALARKEPMVPVKFVDLTEEEEARVLLTLDPLAGMAGVDKTKLDELMKEVAPASDALRQQLATMTTNARRAAAADDGTDTRRVRAPRAVVKYDVIFDDPDQQERFYRVLRWLKNHPDYGGLETVGNRLVTFLDDSIKKLEGN